MTYTAPADYNPRKRWVTYVAVALLVIIALIIMLILWGTHSANATATAQNKAKQLNQALVAAGLQPVDTDVLTGALGKDGGALCADPAGTVAQVAALRNGAAGPGQRPIIAEKRLIQGAGLAIQVYCPGKQQEYTDAIAGLKLEGSS